jgi:hypothetical protein
VQEPAVVELPYFEVVVQEPTVEKLPYVEVVVQELAVAKLPYVEEVAKPPYVEVIVQESACEEQPFVKVVVQEPAVAELPSVELVAKVVVQAPAVAKLPYVEVVAELPYIEVVVKEPEVVELSYVKVVVQEPAVEKLPYVKDVEQAFVQLPYVEAIGHHMRALPVRFVAQDRGRPLLRSPFSLPLTVAPPPSRRLVRSPRVHRRLYSCRQQFGGGRCLPRLCMAIVGRSRLRRFASCGVAGVGVSRGGDRCHPRRGAFVEVAA